MKADKLILIGAVGFAAFLVAQKTGLFKKVSLSSGPQWSGAFLSDTPTFDSPEEQGYDPSNPGKYVFTQDLIKGIGDNDWWYTPSAFETSNRDSPWYQPIWMQGAASQ